MEFYLKHIVGLLLLFLVSIPNGMEFYALPHKHYAPHHRVSIPNGMEFYARLVANLALLSLRFNSQRDGILHICRYNL